MQIFKLTYGPIEVDDLADMFSSAEIALTSPPIAKSDWTQSILYQYYIQERAALGGLMNTS